MAQLTELMRPALRQAATCTPLPFLAAFVSARPDPVSLSRQLEHLILLQRSITLST